MALTALPWHIRPQPRRRYSRIGSPAPMLTRHGDNGPVVCPLAGGLRPPVSQADRDQTRHSRLSPTSLSNDVRVSGPQESDGRADSPPSVLANLPNTRPQRSSARRVAARRGTAAASPAMSTSEANTATATPTRVRPKKATAKNSKAKAKTSRARDVSAITAKNPTSNRSARPTARARAQRPTLPPVPRQGYAAEGDRATGAVQPPGSTELAGSAVELLGELAKAGLSSGERLLRDVLSRLPGA
jgi:hypothetical protein